MPERDEDHHSGHHPVPERAVLLGADGGHAARGVLDTDPDEGQSDHHDDQTGDQRRQGKAQPADDEAERGVEEPANHDTAHEDRERLDPLAGDERDHDRDEGKGRALHHRHACADRPDPDGLDQRRDARKEHRHLDHVDHFRKVGAVRPEAETGCAAHDDCRRDVGDEHREHMLDAQWYGAEGRGVVRVAELVWCPEASISHGNVLQFDRWHAKRCHKD
jgi:hypothetical protein